MRYRWKAYLLPDTLAEALDQLSAKDGHSRIIAGGTDLIVSLEKQDAFIPVIVDICRIPDLNSISINEHDIRIGAGVTLSDIENSEAIKTHAPFLITAICKIGSPQIRNIATLVGNIANASPAADGVLSLLTLNSLVTLRRKDGEREMPLSTFLVGPNKTRCNPDEIITSVHFPIPDKNVYGSFEKVGLRRAMNIAIANVSVVAEIVDGKIVNSRIALGAVGPTAMRASDAELAIAGSGLEDDVVENASCLCMQYSSPIDDIRASAAYRKKMIRALAKRCLSDIKCQIL